MQPGTTLQFEASGIALENAIALNANPTIDTGSNMDAISGVISGSGGLTKIGSGTLILAGENTYAGGTLLDVGTLGIASNGALGAGALAMPPGTMLQFEANGLTLPNAIVLNADPTIDTGSNTDTISGVISGSGTLDKIGSGTLILTAANTYSGPTDVQEGTLGLRGSLASTVTVESGATLGGPGTVGGLIANSGATVRARRALALCDVHRHRRGLLRGRLDLRGRHQSRRPERQARHDRNDDPLGRNGRGQRRERNLPSLDALHPYDR